MALTYLTSVVFGMEPTTPSLKARLTVSWIILGRENDDSNGRMAVSQLAEDRKPSRSGKMISSKMRLMSGVPRLCALAERLFGSFQIYGLSLSVFQNSVQRLANQCVIVDNQNLHKKLLSSSLHGDLI